MSIDLTIKEIEDLATFAGLVINEDNHEEGFYETEITIEEAGPKQVFVMATKGKGKKKRRGTEKWDKRAFM